MSSEEVKTSDVKIKVEMTEKNSDVKDPIFLECMEVLKTKLKDKEVGLDTILNIVKISMEVVEVTKLKGEKQKDLAVKLVRQIVVDSPITDDKEKLILNMVDEGIVGSTIDVIVAASNGQLDINASKNVVKVGCLSLLTNCLKK